MDRETEALKISKSIQKSIDKLKALNFSVDHSNHSVSVFDNEIQPSCLGAVSGSVFLQVGMKVKIKSNTK